MSKAVETAINQLRVLRSNHIPKTGEGTATSNQHAKYGCVFEDGTDLTINSNAKTGWPCHGLLATQSLSKGPVDAVYSLLIEPDDVYEAKEATSAYFSWILGPRSPWRALVYNPSFLFGDQKFIREYGFVFQNLSVLPANQLMNFLVATRMPKEWPSIIKAWYGLVQEGFDERMAFVFLSLFYLEINKTEYTPITSCRYDWPLDVPSRTEAYVRNFLNGEFSYLTSGFNTKSSYGPINELWGKWTPQDTALYVSQLCKTYKHLGTCNKIKGHFGTTMPDYYYWQLTKPEILEILKQEQDRLLSQERQFG